jgi:allantoate deiminase
MRGQREISFPNSRLLMRWLDELGAVTDEPGILTRTFLSPAMKQAIEKVAGWMRLAGLTVYQDEVGNVVGRLEAGKSDSRVLPRTLVLGSHLDTVRNAGRFDGPVGVLLPILALGELGRRGVLLPFAVEVVGFSEEEGVRFDSAYLGSKGYAGLLTAADLSRRDDGGISVAESLSAWRAETALIPRCLPSRVLQKPIRGGKFRGKNMLGYVEVHIEQGPVLEKANLAVGTVSAIASQTRGRLIFGGRAGHAGTTPMNLRKDALAGAAEFIMAAEACAKSQPPLVATVGTIEVTGGASNVIPGQVILTVDVRHAHDGLCKKAVRSLVTAAKGIARRRGLSCQWMQTMQHPATPCSKILSASLSQSVKAVQGRNLSLLSGAGHDAVVMARLTDVAMLFVRCRGGVSHHPDEHASSADLNVALRVVVDLIERLAEREQLTRASRQTF